MRGEAAGGAEMMEVLRDPRDCERELFNAIAAIQEAAIVLRQYRPQTDDKYWWDGQLRKLKMAQGLCSNVRHDITIGDRYAELRKR